MTETMIDGDTFNVIAEGKRGAPAILLVHSLGTNLHVFDRQIAALSPHFHVIRFDSRGHGGSHVTRGDYSIEQLGKDALAILDSHAIDKVHFVGLSAGALVGLWLLSHAPKRIERAVIANAAAQIGTPDFWNERIRVARENGIGTLAPAIAENWFTRQFREQHPEEVHRFEQALSAMSSEGYAGGAAAVRDADFRTELAGIDHPVLVIVGKHDPVTPPGVGALIASAIPGAKTVTLEAAHLSPVEAAEAFNDAVLEFLFSANEKPAETIEPAVVQPKPRKPRASKPKPVPAADSAHERSVAADAIPPEMPKHRPRTPKPKAPEPAAPPARVAPPRKTAAKKASAKKTARKAARKTRAIKKAAAKKSARKTSVKKRVTRKVAVKRAPPRKSAAKKRLVKKAVRRAPRKVAPKKAVRIKKSTAKKSRRAMTKRRMRR